MRAQHRGRVRPTGHKFNIDWCSALVRLWLTPAGPLAARRSERGRQSGITIIAEAPRLVAGLSTSDSKRAPIRINREPGRPRHEWTVKRPEIGPPMERKDAWQGFSEARERLPIYSRLLCLPFGHNRRLRIRRHDAIRAERWSQPLNYPCGVRKLVGVAGFVVRLSCR